MKKLWRLLVGLCVMSAGLQADILDDLESAKKIGEQIKAAAGQLADVPKQLALGKKQLEDQIIGQLQPQLKTLDDSLAQVKSSRVGAQASLQQIQGMKSTAEKLRMQTTIGKMEAAISESIGVLDALGNDKGGVLPVLRSMINDSVEATKKETQALERSITDLQNRLTNKEFAIQSFKGESFVDRVKRLGDAVITAVNIAIPLVKAGKAVAEIVEKIGVVDVGKDVVATAKALGSDVASGAKAIGQDIKSGDIKGVAKGTVNLAADVGKDIAGGAAAVGKDVASHAKEVGQAVGSQIAAGASKVGDVAEDIGSSIAGAFGFGSKGPSTVDQCTTCRQQVWEGKIPETTTDRMALCQDPSRAQLSNCTHCERLSKEYCDKIALGAAGTFLDVIWSKYREYDNKINEYTCIECQKAPEIRSKFVTADRCKVWTKSKCDEAAKKNKWLIYTGQADKVFADLKEAGKKAAQAFKTVKFSWK